MEYFYYTTVVYFLLSSLEKVQNRFVMEKTYSPLSSLFSIDVTLQAYRYSHGKCSDDLNSLVLPTSDSRRCPITSTESNHPQCSRIQYERRKFHSESFLPRIAPMRTDSSTDSSMNTAVSIYSSQDSVVICPPYPYHIPTSSSLIHYTPFIVTILAETTLCGSHALY